MIDWNKFPVLWTLDNDETDSRSLQCPLLGELIGISLFHKVMYWLFYVYFSCVPCKGSHQVLPRPRAAIQCRWLILLRNHLRNRCLQSTYNLCNCWLAVVPTRRLKVSVILHICLCNWHFVLVVVISVIFKLRGQTVIGNPLGIRRSIRLAQKVRWLFLLKLNMAGSWSRINNSIHVVQYPFLYQNKEMLMSRRKKNIKEKLITWLVDSETMQP